VKPDQGSVINLKQKGTSVPSLEKATSVIDEHISEGLLGQAFTIIFSELDRYVKNMDLVKNVSAETYALMIQKERHECGDDFNKYESENLLDEDEEIRLENEKN